MPSKHTAAAAAAVLLSIGGAAANRPDSTRNAAFGNGTNGLAQQRFRSSDVVAPVLQVTSWDKSQTDDSSYIFIGASSHDKTKAAPMILSGKDLSLVYADQQYGEVYASSVQTFNGSKYLTFWEASGGAGGNRSGDGHWLMYDSKYELKYNFTAKGSRDLRDDVPDMRVTRDDTVLLATYETVSWDCSAVGGPADAPLQDSGFQEIDPATNEVLFAWSAREHFNLGDSFATYDTDFGVGSPAGFDFFHLTSVEKSEDGNYLVSSSHLSALAMIDGRDGHVVWTLGGKNSDFKDMHGGNATAFAWQHDAQLVGGDEVVLFDNHGRSSTGRPAASRGLRLRLDLEQKTVELVKEFHRPEGGVRSGSGGGVQLLKEGHAMVAWGGSDGSPAAAFVEYNKAGQPVMDVRLGSDDDASITTHDATYRVSRHRWQGEPTWPPSVAVDAPSGSTAGATVYVSWNGATDVSHWAILASDTPDTVSHYKNVIARANRTGFETQITLDNGEGGVSRRYIGAAALSAAGDVMGASFVYDMRTGRAVMQASGITTVNPPVKATAAAGAMGGSIFGVSMLFYIVNYFWRRKGGGSSAAQAAADHGAYEKVGSAV
ncbi:Arylsulfotransferase [Cordyceps fumosorosea ARSEF 2679]|uniref:Arylsulfotransferase n=1 Tax=Cordyceps fumosorosea (strain ARSEF 2679) TaxID=1081104 RepID=A0A162JQI6_CORFA|nr:Arylsulfotransferase [Cordyceps fumosorosea ARSEF 2679]OAA72302.1 Arylsulfotransferase [Cordyceps fumosorosea ARSEF 2679]